MTDRLGPLDTAFLCLETADAPMHLGGVAVFENPVPSRADIVRLIRRRILRLEHYRHVIRRSVRGFGALEWAPDPDLQVGRHVHAIALAAPGDDHSLDTVVGQLMSTPLPRDRPLWECWLVEGLQEGRWALVNKVHHCLADGIAATGLLEALLDPADEATPDTRPRPMRPRAAAAGRPARRMVAPAAARGLANFGRLAVPASPSSLSGPLGTNRVWAHARLPRQDVDDVRAVYGGTLNDVVLSALTAGYRELLVRRGEVADPRAVRALVPVSVRGDRTADRVDNEISAYVAELPVHLDDPVDRLIAVRQQLGTLKASGEGQAGRSVVAAAQRIPALLFELGLSAFFRLPQRFVTTVTTNVPGPAVPLSAAGRRMCALYPYVPIGDRVRVGVAATSYLGEIYLGVTADAASTPDLDVFVDAARRGMADLVRRAHTLSGAGEKAADESTCRPGSVLDRSRGTAIHLGLPSPTGSSGLPAGSGGPPSNACADVRRRPS